MATGGSGVSIAALHGSGANDFGGHGETDIIEIRGEDANLTLCTITDIDGVRFAGGAQQTVFFSASHVEGGLAKNLVVTGSSNNVRNHVVIREVNGTSDDVDLSGWQFSNFSRQNQQVQVETISDNQADEIIATVKRDFISSGGGNDAITGGKGGDTIFGGAGSDLFLYAAQDSALGKSVDAGAENSIQFA